MFRISDTDFYIHPDRYGYHVGFMPEGKKPADVDSLELLWQFDDLDSLFLRLPEQVDIFMRTSRSAGKAMKSQKKALRQWLLSEGRQAVPRIRHARQVLHETIDTTRKKAPAESGESIFATSLVLKPFKNTGYEIYKTREEESRQTEEFVGYFASYEKLLKELPLFLSEEDFSWRDVGVRDVVSQYETCVNWVRFFINPATFRAA